jgi:(R,R)-butanediol dehydrogenase / meso-butanediol dehydrogenase / diacetyl reductase
MKAAVIKNINNVEVCDIKKPSIKKGHVLLKIACSGFCGPTEICIIEGLHPRAKFPLVFCHEFSGTVEECGKASGFKKGEKVTVNPLIACGNCYACRQGDGHICRNLKLIGIDYDGGFAEYCLAPEKNLVRLPKKMSLKLAALAEPVAVCLHAVRSSVFKTGDTVMVFGAGPIGLITAIILRIAGADVIVVEKEQKRILFAESLGFETVSNLDEFKENDSRLIDLIFETSGAPSLLPYAVDLVKIKGFISIVGKFDKPELFNLHDVLFKEITAKGSRVYRSEEFKQAVIIISKNAMSFENLITDLYNLDDINAAIDDFKKRSNLCKIMINNSKDR